MGSRLQAHAQFERSRWRLRVLLPLWILQLALTLTMAGLFAWRLGDSLKHSKERKDAGEVTTLELVWESTNVGLSTVSTLCTIFEIARFIAESLTPWIILCTHTIKLACAAGVLSIDVVAHIKKIDSHYSIIGLAFSSALLLTAGALFVYAIITYNRLSREGGYRHQIGVGVRGYSYGDDHDHYRDSSYSGKLLRPTIEKRLSSASSRMSINSARRSSNGSPDQQQQQQQHEEEADIAMGPIRRSSSYYNHERDTQFDDYVARRKSSNGDGANGFSVGATKADMDGVVDHSFGWTSSPTEGSGANNGDQDMVVKMGGVVNGRPRASSVSRLPSAASHHVLVSVPEEVDHDDKDTAPLSTRTRTAEEEEKKDREALLGRGASGEGRRSWYSFGEDRSRVPQEVDIPEPRWQRE